MKSVCVFFVLALLANGALSMNLRQKRQSEDGEDLEDRYGWNRPTQRPWSPNQGQWQFPGQGQQFPGQGQQFPGQGQQFPGQWQQFPGQGQQFPGQGQQFPGQWQQFPGQGQNQQTTSTTASSVSTTTLSSTQQQCIRSCPVTAEYNPVCGSDNQTYTNPGRLTCAQQCRIAVSQVRSSPCPTSTTEASPTGQV